MKTKEQQYEEYKANGGTLDFYSWQAAFKYDPSLEFTKDEIHDWVMNYSGDTGCIPTEEEWKKILAENKSITNESYITFKKERREIMTSTILSLLADMPHERIKQILEGDTPEELVDWCKVIYDREFDLNVDALGTVGADEIAWHEALGIFNDTSDT